MTLTNLESLRHFIPEGIVALTIIVLLVADMATGARRRGLSASIAFGGLVLAFVAGLLQTGSEPAFLFEGMLTLDPFGTFFVDPQRALDRESADAG